jgi:hypothetical protein
MSTLAPINPFENCTPKQVAAIHGLLTHPRIEDAAKAAGISRSGLYRMMTQPHFREALALLQRERFAALNQELTKAGLEAVTVLGELMTDTAVLPSSRIRAAEILLVHTLRGYELTTISDQLQALEAQIGASHGSV